MRSLHVKIYYMSDLHPGFDIEKVPQGPFYLDTQGLRLIIPFAYGVHEELSGIPCYPLSVSLLTYKTA